jgi:hypothetical protein
MPYELKLAGSTEMEEDGERDPNDDRDERTRPSGSSGSLGSGYGRWLLVLFAK